MLQTINVTKSFANHRALDNVSINVPEQSIYGLLGPNGAGKTTLIRIINRITAPDEGEVLINNKNLTQDDIAIIGYLPEERGLYKKMKVGEQAIYLARLKGLSKNEALKRLKHWFTYFDIMAWWNKKVEELSKGMAQKVQFIVTIVHEPKLLIFDEPFSGFDPINVNLLKDEILRLRDNGSTIIFSTHNMSSVEELCDDIALINKSQKIMEGSVKEVKQQYKTNTFRIEYDSWDANADTLAQDGIRVISNKVNGHGILDVKAPAGMGSNELLHKIMPAMNIKSFNEIIPSMNDIFIRIVKESPN